MKNKRDFNLYRGTWCRANLGPVVVSLTANEIKPGTHSPTLLANAGENGAFMPAGCVCLLFHLSLTQHNGAVIGPDSSPRPLCESVCARACEMVEEGLGVIRAVRMAVALWLIAAIRLRLAVLESITANEENTRLARRCVRVVQEQ